MSRFDASYSGIGEMLRSEFMEAAMVARAEAAKEVAVAAAPYEPESETHYRDAFEVTSRRDGGYDHNRAAAQLSNSDEAALWIEIGSKHIEAHHTMTKALDAAGGE